MTREPVKLGDVLKQVSRKVVVLDDVEYPELGLRAHGNGTFHKPPVNGSETTKDLYSVEAGDLLLSVVFAWEGAAAVAGPADHGRFTSHRFPAFRCDPSLGVEEYMALWLVHGPGRQLLVANSPGGAGRNKTLNKTALLACTVRLPSVAEQRRIVDLLSTADASVESLEVELASARNVRRQLLIDAVRNHEALPFSKPVKLGDIAESQLGKMLNTSRQTGKGVRPYLRAANITGWGTLDLSSLKSMDFDEAELDKFSVKTGDLLVTEGGDAGRCAVYAGEEALCFQNAIHRVRADRSKTSNEYLALVLEHLSATGQLDRYCSTTTIKHLSSGSLKSIELRLPTLAVQQSAVANIKAATTLAEAVSSRLQQAKHLRDQLLHDLLSGAHTIPESYDRSLAEVPA